MYNTSTHDGMREFASSHRRMHAAKDPALQIRPQQSATLVEHLAYVFPTEPESQQIAKDHGGPIRIASSALRSASDYQDEKKNIVQPDNVASAPNSSHRSLAGTGSQSFRPVVALTGEPPREPLARPSASIVVIYAAFEMAEPLHFLGRLNHILTFPVRSEGAVFA
jgi:hypothetical protein